MKLQESTISMLIGVLVVILVGYIAIQFFAQRNSKDNVPPPIETETAQESEPQIHTVEKGESLWTISEKYYGTGYNWVDIKDANELSDADQIKQGDELVIPQISPRIAQANVNSTESTSSNEEKSTSPSVSPKAQKPSEELSENSENKSETKTSEEDSKGKEHVVQQGESLWTIAQKAYDDGNKWVQIAKANNLVNPSVIHAGDTLVLEETQQGQVSDQAASAENYTVQKGDSLWTIAQGAYGDGNKWTEIASANNLSHPSVIHSGNQLAIPR